MSFLRKIVLLFFLLGVYFIHAQTAGLNYQALILNTKEIQIPGTNVSENQVPLGLEEVIFRFSISNQNEIEYIELQSIITDENGMVSLIVGEGIPTNSTFDNITWDGELKYLNVEINILSNNEGFIFLDTQKILSIPSPIKVSNGLYKDGAILKLGGSLIEPTSINTNEVNTLAIKGLQESISMDDEVVIAEKDTDVLKKRSLSSIVQKKQVVIIAIDGQVRFETPLTIFNSNKLDVYRNGVRISFVMVNDTTIEIDPEAICYEGDEIRIVQLN
jgi:hypothetical protein